MTEDIRKFPPSRFEKLDKKVEIQFFLEWKTKYCKGIRNKTLINLMWLDYVLHSYSLTEKKLNEIEGKAYRRHFSTYLQDPQRIKDIEDLLKCSNRTARDYRDSLSYINSVTRSTRIKFIDIEKKE